MVVLLGLVLYLTGALVVAFMLGKRSAAREDEAMALALFWPLLVLMSPFFLVLFVVYGSYRIGRKS